MRLNDLIIDYSFIITDLETSRTTDAEISLMKKILGKLRSRMNDTEKTKYNNTLEGFEKRMKQIETIDKEIKEKLAELRVFQDMGKAIDEVQKDGNKI